MYSDCLVAMYNINMHIYGRSNLLDTTIVDDSTRHGMQASTEKFGKKMPTSTLPTAQEVLASNESKLLFRTNLLRLQLEELHSNITPDYRKLSKLEKLVSSISQALMELTDVTISSDAASDSPSYTLHSRMLSDLQISKAQSADLVGSFKHRTMVKPLQDIDMTFTIPATCLGERDIKSHRYFDRKLVFCHEVLRQLKSKISGCDLSLRYWLDDSDKPIISVSVPNSVWRVNLIPSIQPSTFDEKKLTPDYKNLEESTTCDPLYNLSILEDMYFSSDVFSSPRHLHFAQAVQLIKVWLYRRGLLVTPSHFSGLSGYQICAILSHVCHNLPREVSAYQMFKLFASLLAKFDWEKNVLVHGSPAATRQRLDLTLPYPVMECSQIGSYNPLWRIPIAIMGELKIEAEKSLVLLDDPNVRDPFEALFCQTSRERDFELSLKLNNSHNQRRLTMELGCAIKTALSNRLSKSQVYLRYGSDGSVSVKGDIDGSFASVFIDRGPSADSVDAAKFRAFWGKKAELRRFKDGSILECVVWDPKQGPVAEQIIRHIVSAKFNEEKIDIAFCPLGACQSVSRSHIALWSSLETLRVKLTSIEKLPISVVNLRPCHARFTGTDLVSSSGVLAPLDCIVEFETSSAWPTTRVAVWNAKCAFLLAIREGLMGQYCAVEIGAEDMAEEPFIDVRMMDGEKSSVAFRLRIYANIEKQRLMNQLASVDSPPTLAEVATVGQLWFAPMLRARVHALSATCPAITGAISQAKAWLDNHLLLQPWLADWVEVTMAHVVESKGCMAPQSPHVALLDWLFFMANHSFKTTPIFANLGGDEVTSDQLSERYEASVDGRRSWWISSDIDPDCLFIRRPTEWEAIRIQALAKDALNKAKQRKWDSVKFGTDNGIIFDLIAEINSEYIDSLDEFVKVLSEQFRKYLSIHYSKVHGIVGVRMELGAFRPQSRSSLEKSKLLTVVDDLAIPDVTAIMSKLGAYFKGVSNHIRVRPY